MKRETKIVHGQKGYDKETGAISYPIYMSSTFRHPGFSRSTGYDYSRMQNPTREELECTLAALECGERCFAYSSGMAAITSVFYLFPGGSHILLSEDLYGGTPRLAAEFFAAHNIEFEFIDTSNLELVKSSIKENTKALFIETPSNPMMIVSDIQALADIIHAADGLFIVDNTFLTPMLQRPLTLGADISLHSGTKYLCGHNDIIAGFVIAKGEKIIEKLGLHYKSTGAILSPFDSWLMIRSIKTLSVRIQRQQENAGKIVDHLLTLANVTDVYYVGLADHAGYEITKKQTEGFGAMISFKVKTPEIAKEVLGKVKLIYFAESLGGVETLMTYPIAQTHAEVPKWLTSRVGIDERLLRLSVGIEDVADLIADLNQAFIS